MLRRSERKRRKRVPAPRSLNHTVLGRVKNTTLMDANETQRSIWPVLRRHGPDVWRCGPDTADQS